MSRAKTLFAPKLDAQVNAFQKKRRQPLARFLVRNLAGGWMLGAYCGFTSMILWLFYI